MDNSGKMQRIPFSFQLSLLFLLLKGDVVWCECSLNGMEIEGGEFTLSDDQNEGSMLRYHCPKGYYPHPALAYRCQLSGQWTPEHRKSSCKRVECPDPNVLQNGYISPTQSNRKYFYDYEITYHCYSGYTLHGPLRRTCLENGKWSDSNPVCRTDYGDCPDPGVPPGGSRSGNSFDIGDTVTFKCNDNMILMGSEERECQVNGHWSGTEPSCYYSHTYDSPWEVTEAFGGDLKNTLVSNSVNETQQVRSIKLTRDGTLNIFFALDVSESINETDFQNAKTAVTTLINKIETFSVYPRYEVVLFSSKIHTVINILDFYGKNDPSPPIDEMLEKFRTFHIEREDKYGTNIQAVIDHIETKLSSIKTRDERFSEHHHVIIFFTDGGYNTGGQPSVDRIKSFVYMGQPHQRQDHLDIYVFAIGSPIHDGNLKPLVVGTGGKSHYYRLKDVKALQKTFDEIIDESDVQGRCGLHQDYGAMYSIKQKRRKYPWIIEITVLADRPEYCLGSLVSPRFVLTAAHCFKSKNYTVSVEVSSDHKLVVNSVHIHPDFNIKARVDQGVTEFFDFDVALIELVADVPISISLRPICIPCTVETNAALRETLTCSGQENFLLKNGVRVTFLTKTDRQEKTDLLEKAAHVKLGEDRFDCIDKARSAPGFRITDARQAVTENFLCTGGLRPYLDNIACTGDSGGAVFTNYQNRTIQLALVSWGTQEMPDCKKEDLVSSNDVSRDFHINLFKVLPFLKEILGKTDKSYAPLVFVD